MMTNFLGCGLLAISNIIKLTKQQRILLGTGFCGGAMVAIMICWV
jgi:fluoride ion exporter CrcB/FEX